MAQNAKVSSLTDELIQSLLKFDPATNRQAYRHAKEIASRNLRGHQYARTNQFDITASFAGLDEKFRVKSRDDLADALQVRLQKLEGYTNKYKPDILSLLLQLADRPLENTQVEALELLRPPSPPPPLTWSEILQEDPYSDDEIWKDIDYGGDSSGDEKTSKKRQSQPSPLTSVDEDDTCNPVTCITSTEKELVAKLESAQFWTSGSGESEAKVEITELQAVRETLFMLAGLRTSLYQSDRKQHNIRFNSRYILSHASSATVEHFLSQFVAIGTSVGRLRIWTRKAFASPLVETFEAAVRKRLLQFDRSLSLLQQQYLIPETPIPVSLLQLHTDVQTLSIPILRLARLVSDVEPHLLRNPFSHLEALFEQTTLAQMTLEDEVFRYMSETFFECLQTYLRPIRRWMEAGELSIDEDTFFVSASDSSSDAASLWHDRYVLRLDGQNSLRSPSFLHPAAKKIFNTGKSVVFLKELGIYDTESHALVGEPILNHEMVCGSEDVVLLSPFPELFQAAFEDWIRSKYSVASTVLRQHIFENDGLVRVLTAFEMLYLSRDGAIFEDFATAIFERMDAGRKGWNDRYILTEIARGVFGTTLSALDAERIVMRSTKTKAQVHSVKGLAALSVDFAVSFLTIYHVRINADERCSCRGQSRT
jgi:gamma-tubulin complex component 5